MFVWVTGVKMMLNRKMENKTKANEMTKQWIPHEKSELEQREGNQNKKTIMPEKQWKSFWSDQVLCSLTFHINI